MKLVCEKVSCWYGQVVALSDVSFSVGPGVTGLLGPNGAGKTSMIRLATGQIRPRTGRVTLGQSAESPWRNRALLSRLGYAPEGDAFWPRLSGREFVQSLLGLSGFVARDRRLLAQRALERVGLVEEAADRAVSGYSKGMKQRLKLAAAMAHEPDFLFLDEPFDGADPVGRRVLMDLVRALGDEGKVVVLSSHVLHEVQRLADQVVVLRRGKVLASGALAEIRRALDSHPAELFVAGSGVRALARVLVSSAHLQGIRFEGSDRLRLRTSDPDRCFDEIGAHASEHGGVSRLMRTDDTLEAVFEYLAGSGR